MVADDIDHSLAWHDRGEVNKPLLPTPRDLDIDWRRIVENAEPDVRHDRSIHPEGYRLTIEPGGVEVAAGSAPGEFYARQTLAQLAKISGGGLPCGRITDWPDFGVRAVMIDISRDKVPTMASLFALAERLASWKVNQLQLYTEHTFAYRNHETVWRNASPLTPDEIHLLDAYCRDRHIELVPNQNCLGHFERWLRHDEYRDLAIKPEGLMLFGRPSPPTTLDPAKSEAFELVETLLTELLPNFTSKRVHVGLDEPWELASDRAQEYLGWLRRLRECAALDGREMLVWGDFLASHPKLIDEIPDGVTVCEWGYEGAHPFEERAAWLEGTGRPYWVCPGTSSWLSIIGRWTNAQPNLLAAARAGIGHGADGYLNTDWGDLGHIHYPPVSLPGIAYGAAVSWCAEANDEIDVAAALDVHAFGDSEGLLGSVIVDLGQIYTVLTPQIPNIATMVLHLYYPEVPVGQGPLHLAVAGEYEEARSRLADCRDRLMRARPTCDDGELVISEIKNAIALVDLLCRDALARLDGDGSIASVPTWARRRFVSDLDAIGELHRALWLERNRPGGLDDTMGRFGLLRDAYES